MPHYGLPFPNMKFGHTSRFNPYYYSKADLLPNPKTVPTLEELYHNFLLNHKQPNHHTFNPNLVRYYHDPFIHTHPLYAKTNYDTKFFVLDNKKYHHHHNAVYDNHHFKLHDILPCPKKCGYAKKYYCPHHRPRCTKECYYKAHDWCPHHSIGCPRKCSHYHKECCPIHRPYCPRSCSYVTHSYCPHHRPGCIKGCKHYHERFCPLHRPGCIKGCKHYNHLYCPIHRPRCPKNCSYFSTKRCPYHGYFNPYKPHKGINPKLWHEMLVFYGYHYNIKNSFHHLGKFTDRQSKHPNFNKSNNDNLNKCPTCPPNIYVTKGGKTTNVYKLNKEREFGESTNKAGTCPCPVYNGLMNFKLKRMSSSANTDHKKNTQLFNDLNQNFNCTKNDMCDLPNSRHGGVGGPGKLQDSQPKFKTRVVTGYKARLISPFRKGVDKKHGSYERYLMKKKALYQQKELCFKCK